MSSAGMDAGRPWETRFESKLLSTARDLRIRYNEILMDAASLTLSEALLLFYLQDNGPVNQSQLSLMVGVGRAQVGAMVTKLCDDDLLERTKDDSDGRAWLVDLTRDGHRRAALLRRIDFEVADYVGRGMETADRRALIGLLDRVQKNLEVFDDVSLRPGKSQAEEERAG